MRWIIGNWKMNGTRAEARQRTQELLRALPPLPEGLHVAVCPPYTSLGATAEVLTPPLELGAQDVSWQDSGAFTGEVSAPMLRDAGCGLCVVGHSERRQLLGESDGMVAQKLRALWRHGLLPVLCVGETLAEREQGRTEEVLRMQLLAALEGSSPADLLVAYEPVWAIGTGRPAHAADSARGLGVLRQALDAVWGADGAGVPCLYGGSVSAANCAPFWTEGRADGALLGGASLDAQAFAAIVRSAAEVRP